MSQDDDNLNEAAEKAENRFKDKRVIKSCDLTVFSREPSKAWDNRRRLVLLVFLTSKISPVKSFVQQSFYTALSCRD